MVSSDFISPCNSAVSSCSSSSSASSHVRSAEALHRRLDELKDIYGAMLRQEATTYKVTIPNDEEDENWRPLMVNWMYSIVDIFQLTPCVVGTAMYYLDKAHSMVQTPADYQLLGLTALQLAIKVHETKIFPMEQLVQIGNSCFTVTDIVEMEQRLLEHLHFRLHPPTAECFVHAFYELLPQRPQIIQNALASVRRAMLAPQLQETPYSVLAYASLLVAMESASRLTLEHKKTFGWNMMQLAGLTADTKGLVVAYEVLAPPSLPTGQSSPMPASRSSSPMPANKPASPTTATATQPQPASTRQAPPPSTEVIFGTEDGIEVQWCSSTDEADADDKVAELQLSASFSPRQVAC